MKRKNNNAHGPDKELRRARDRFHAPKTQSAIHTALTNIGVTESDIQRITEQLEKRLRQFKHIDHFKVFREEVTNWAVMQAQLIPRLHELVREFRYEGHVNTMLFLRLPEFLGTGEDFLEWVQTTVEREQQGLQAFASWTAEHRQAVRAGIWRVMKTCQDLGLGKFTDEEERTRYPVVEELEIQVWQDVVYEVDKILSTPEPVFTQLYSRGYWAARAWKTAILRENAKRAGDKYFIGLNGLETVVKSSTGEMEKLEVAVESVRDVRADLNPLTLRPDLLWNGQDSARVWVQADVERDLRHAGPFRADGNDDVAERYFAIAA